MKMGVNQSQIAAFAGCRWKWGKAYVQHLVPRRTRPVMYLGTMVHAGLDAALRGYLDAQSLGVADPSYPGAMAMTGSIETKVEEYFAKHELWDEEKEATLADAEKAKALAIRAYWYFIERYEPVYIGGVPAVEFRMRRDLYGFEKYDHFHGTADAVVRERATGQQFLMDWKVRGTLQPHEDEEVSLQMAAYQDILVVDYGLNIVGSLCFQIFNELPRIPKLTTKGEMSRADLKTDWPTYKQAVIDAGLDPEDYLDMVPKLEAKEFFRLSKAYRTRRETTGVWLAEIQPVIVAMDSYVDAGDLYRNLSAWNCKNCNYRHLCLETLRGGDVEYIESTDFMVKDPDAEEAEAEVASS